MKRFIVVVGVVLALGACTPVQKAFIDRGVQAAKDANDTEALVLKQAACAIRIGASYRVLTTAEREHVEGLCGSKSSTPVISVEALRILGIIR